MELGNILNDSTFIDTLKHCLIEVCPNIYLLQALKLTGGQMICTVDLALIFWNHSLFQLHMYCSAIWVVLASSSEPSTDY